ncbi:hypothetical protein [Nocardia brasiliensis]|uniref:hypothetical protein n=1 Tax=Nocardia brasiliensis TaxID=37326 RepID=UPI00366F8435
MSELTTGDRLRAELACDGDPYARTVLIVEAARVADRLDVLNDLLTGDERLWLRLADGRDGTLDIRVDGALAEARQQANTLRQLLAEIRRQGDDTADEADDDDLADL